MDQSFPLIQNNHTWPSSLYGDYGSWQNLVFETNDIKHNKNSFCGEGHVEQPKLGELLNLKVKGENKNIDAKQEESKISNRGKYINFPYQTIHILILII